MGERESRQIRAYLRSGEKQHKDILALFKGGEPSARTIERDLKSLVNQGEVEKRRKGRWMMYRFAGLNAQLPEFPPYDKAPRKLVDQQIERLETVLTFPEDETASLVAALDFVDLCQSYRKVAHSPDAITRIFGILDRILNRFENFPDEVRYHLARAFDILVRRSLGGKEDPRIVSESRKRIELLSKACLEAGTYTSSCIHDIISNIDKRKARKIFIKMITMEKFPIDLLVGDALSLYHEDYGELIGELRKLKERFSGRPKRRIEEFEQKLEQALKLR